MPKAKLVTRMASFPVFTRRDLEHVNVASPINASCYIGVVGQKYGSRPRRITVVVSFEVADQDMDGCCYDKVFSDGLRIGSVLECTFTVRANGMCGAGLGELSKTCVVIERHSN